MEKTKIKKLEKKIKDAYDIAPYINEKFI